MVTYKFIISRVQHSVVYCFFIFYFLFFFLQKTVFVLYALDVLKKMKKNGTKYVFFYLTLKLKIKLFIRRQHQKFDLQLTLE